MAVVEKDVAILTMRLRITERIVKDHLGLTQERVSEILNKMIEEDKAEIASAELERCP